MNLKKPSRKTQGDSGVARGVSGSNFAGNFTFVRW